MPAAIRQNLTGAGYINVKTTGSRYSANIIEFNLTRLNDFEYIKSVKLTTFYKKLRIFSKTLLTFVINNK